MFLIALDKYFLNTLSASYAIDETDKTTFVSPIIPLFGQTLTQNGNLPVDLAINYHSFSSESFELTIPKALSSGQVRILNTAGQSLTDSLFENFYPLTGAIRKIYIVNASLTASFTNVRVVPYSVLGKVSVEISTDGQTWTSQGIVVPSWANNEIKEFYLRIKLNNAQLAYDAIGLTITYQSATGKIQYGYNALSGQYIATGGYNPFGDLYLQRFGTRYVIMIAGTLYIHNTSTNSFSGAGYSSSRHFFAVSRQKNYLFYSTKIFRTSDMTAIISLNDVSDKGWAAGFTPDERYFVYSSTSGLKVIAVPTGDVVAVYPQVNLDVNVRSAALYPISPDEIWFFDRYNYARFKNGEPFYVNSLFNGTAFFAQYWLDESTFAIIDKGTYSGYLVNADNMKITRFVYATSGGDDFNLCVPGTLIASQTYTTSISGGYSRGYGHLLTPSTGRLVTHIGYYEGGVSHYGRFGHLEGYVYGIRREYLIYYNKIT